MRDYRSPECGHSPPHFAAAYIPHPAVDNLTAESRGKSCPDAVAMD